MEIVMDKLNHMPALPITSGNGRILQVKTGEDGMLISDQQVKQNEEERIAFDKHFQESGKNVKIGRIETSEESTLRATNYFNSLISNLETIGSQMYEMDSLTADAMSDIAKEQPALMRKQFDFTLKEGKIEVVNHNLNDKEKSYLENKLNDNTDLVETLDKLNGSLAEKYKVGVEDIEGRLKVLEFQDRVSDYVYHTFAGDYPDEVFENNYANRYASSGAVNQVLKHTFPAPVSTKV